MKWRGKLNLKTGEKSWHTVLCCSQPNNVSCRNHSSTWISITLSKRRQKENKKWTTFTTIHMHRLAWKRNTFDLCSEHFESSYFSRSMLIGTPVDFRRFYLEEGSVPSIYTKPKDSLDIDYSRNEARLANRFFPRNLLWTFLWDPAEKRQYPKFQPPPQKKNIDFFSDWVGLFEICFRSSEMTDPRGWVYFRVPSCSTETCQIKLKQTANNELQKSIFLGVRETSQEKTPPSRQTSISHD